MATRTTLKGYFETGDAPTQAQFGTLIDSMPNITDDFDSIETKIYSQDIVFTGAEQNITLMTIPNGYVFATETIVFIVVIKTGSSSDNTDAFDIESGLLALQWNDTVDTVVGGTGYLYSDDLTATAYALVAGITALTLRVICKGIMIPTT